MVTAITSATAHVLQGVTQVFVVVVEALIASSLAAGIVGETLDTSEVVDRVGINRLLVDCARGRPGACQTALISNARCSATVLSVVIGQLRYQEQKDDQLH